MSGSGRHNSPWKGKLGCGREPLHIFAQHLSLCKWWTAKVTATLKMNSCYLVFFVDYRGIRLKDWREIQNLFCPKCCTEYREGFTTCADCKVPLVLELHQDLNKQETSKKDIVYGRILIFLSFPAWFLAIIGGTSNAYGLETIQDKLTDLVMRLLFVGAPLGFLTAGSKLLNEKKSSLFFGMIEALIFSMLTFIHAIYWLREGRDIIFGVICLCLGIFFLGSLIYLAKTLLSPKRAENSAQ